MNQEIKEKLMRLAMKEAAKATKRGNPPFGAVLTDMDGNLIAKDYNTTNSKTDPTAHAQMNLIRQVTKKLKSQNLSDYCLVSNAQDCSMCFDAAIKANIKNFIFGYAEDHTLTPKITVFEMNERCEQKANIETGILKEECQKQIEEARKIVK